MVNANYFISQLLHTLFIYIYIFFFNHSQREYELHHIKNEIVSDDNLWVGIT